MYNFDGPGFNVDFRGTDGYLAIKSRIRSIVPECSVVGMFLDHEERYMVVKSSRKGIAQHDALSWSVIGSHFERAEGLSPEIIRINGVLASWIKEMDNERLEKFTECFFGLLLSTKAETITGLMSNKKALLKALTSAEPETRKALFDAFKLLLGESGKSVTGWLRRKEKKTVEMSVK